MNKKCQPEENINSLIISSFAHISTLWKKVGFYFKKEPLFRNFCVGAVNVFSWCITIDYAVKPIVRGINGSCKVRASEKVWNTSSALKLGGLVLAVPT